MFGKTDQSEEQFKNRVKFVSILIFLFQLSILLLFFSDLTFNYFLGLLFDIDVYIDSVFYKATFYIIFVAFMILTGALFLSTFQILNLVEKIEDDLRKETQFLKLIMWIFSLTYNLVGIYYLINVILKIRCHSTSLNNCYRLGHIWVICFICLVCDALPNMSLYLCHYKAMRGTKERLEMQKQKQLVRQSGDLNDTMISYARNLILSSSDTAS